MNISEFRATVEGLKLPRKLSLLAVWGVPSAELVLSVCMGLQPLMRIGQIGLLLLLAAFSWVVYRAKSQKLSLDCNCFGPLLSDQIGWKTVLHIMIFLAMDGYILWQQQVPDLSTISLIEWISSVSISIGILIIYSVGTNYLNYVRAWSSFGGGIGR